MKLTDKPTGHLLFAQLCSSLQQGSELADAPMRCVDNHLAQLKRLGLLRRSIVVGPVVISRSYGVDGPGDSGEFVQAAVTTSHGTAAVFWNSDDFAEFKSDNEFEAEAFLRTRPLRDCSPAIRSMVWPHIDLLLLQLIAQCKLS